MIGRVCVCYSTSIALQIIFLAFFRQSPVPKSHTHIPVFSPSRFRVLFIYLLGMSELVKERPANPIEYLASYLLRHDPQRAGSSDARR